MTSNELITTQVAHSLTEILHTGVIPYSKGNADALRDSASFSWV